MVRKNAIIEWFHKAGWGVNAIEHSEIQTNCPKCGYGNFYFNIRKLVGICHKARCDYHIHPPILEDLEKLAGFGPDEHGGFRVRVDDPIPVRNSVEVTLPGDPVIQVIGGQQMTKYPKVVDYLVNRRLTSYDVLRFKLTCDETRVYVPVFKGETLINYVGRDLTGKERKKYLYSKGAKTSEWLFGWDECQGWERLTLVENTFVSISFRNVLQCTTNFGSSLSDAQITLIAKSKIKTVAILWDEGTHRSANKAVRKLANHGVNACYAIMKGQPDEHDPGVIYQIASDCHEVASKGVRYLDPFGIGSEKRQQDVENKKQQKRRSR